MKILNLVLMKANCIRSIIWVSIKQKKKLEWPELAFKFKLKNTYEIEIHNVITSINDNKLNNIAEFNLLHDLINPPKRTTFLNRYYSPILHGCMNTRKGKSRFKNFWILLDSEFSSINLMGRLVEKLHTNRDDVMHWHIQAGNITTNLKV